MLYKKKFAILLLIFSCTNTFANEKLILAIDLIRHGDRTPLQQIPKSPYSWQEGLGALTEEGRKQEIQLGIQLRKKYIDQDHLLSAKYDSNSMYVRSTSVPRAIDSAKAFLSAFYPDDYSKIPIHTIPKENDDVLIPKLTKNVFSLIKLYAFARTSWGEKTKDKKGKINYWSQVTGLPIRNFQQLDPLADNLYIRQLHHIHLPEGLNTEDANEIIALNDWAIITGFKQAQVSYPTGHHFLLTIANYLQQAAEKKSPLKYILFSGHDGSILSVMNTLKVPLDKIPPYASDLNFSLFENNQMYFVKINFNNQPVKIPQCNQSNICSLTQFIHLVHQL